MFFRKLVFMLYVFQTVLSSLPPPCYGMELDDGIVQSKGRKSNNPDREASSGEGAVILEIVPLLDSSKKNAAQRQKTKPQEIKDPIILLNGHLNYYLNHEKHLLFPKYYKEFDTTLEVKTALIDTRKKAKIKGSVDNSSLDKSSVDNSPFTWDEGFVLLEEIDKRFVQRRSAEPLPLEWPWRLLRGVGILGCGGITILYALSPFGIDPTRLMLINTALPLEIQSTAAIGISAGFAGYHVLPHAMEGWNTSTGLYQRLFKNWGLPNTHGFMTRNNDEHKELRDLATLRESKKKGRHP